VISEQLGKLTGFMARDNIQLSIIVLSYNTRELLKKCLGSVISDLQLAVREKGRGFDTPPITNHQPPITEIIVVDNGSTDGSVEEIKNEKLKIKNKDLRLIVIENKKNVGFAKGNNQGIKEAGGEYIMLLNSDTVVEPGAIKKLLGFLENNPSVAVSPLLILPSGRLQTDYYMRFPNFWQIFLYHNPILRPMVMRISFLRLLIARKAGDKPFKVDQLPGAVLLASREVWGKVGFLDEDYHFLFEDVDWCWRAKRLGIGRIVVSGAKITHIGGASWKQSLKENSFGFYYQFFASMLLFFRKNYGKFNATIFKWLIIINFFLTLKPKLAWQFIKNDGKQKNFL